MKPKRISKKLNLNKETVADLSNKEMRHLKAGDYLTENFCESEYCTDYATCGVRTCVTCDDTLVITCFKSCVCTQTGIPCCK